MFSTTIGLVSLLAFSAPSGRDIVDSMDKVDDGKTQYSVRMMLTCTFKVKAGKRSCASKPRKKVIEGIQMDMGINGRDGVSMSYILEPATERGMAFKQYDYDEVKDTSEQWMYMPALKKLKRIVSDSSNGPRTGTLFGSEIGYEDIERRKLDDYTYKLLGEDKVDGQDVYLVESTPTAKHRSQTSYGKSKSWVNKANYMLVKNELYDHQGALVKTFFFKDIRQMGDIWLSGKMAVVNHQKNRMSMFALKKLAVNPELTEAMFENRVLDDGAYREKLLAPIRALAK